MKKLLMIMLVALVSYTSVYAQDCMRCTPEKYEKVLGSITTSFSGTFYRESDSRYIGGYSDQQIYNILLNKAKQEYPYTQNLKIRNAKIERTLKYIKDNKGHDIGSTYYYNGTFSVVVENSKAKTNMNAMGKLRLTANKALGTIPQGTRMAIDKIIVPNTLNGDDFKDQLLDILLDKGYRVVAKEYLERLYSEQQDQQSGIFNDSTTVQGNNFTAAGYLINLKITETSIRVQAVNVSTGEYEGNATVNY